MSQALLIVAGETMTLTVIGALLGVAFELVIHQSAVRSARMLRRELRGQVESIPRLH